MKVVIFNYSVLVNFQHSTPAPKPILPVVIEVQFNTVNNTLYSIIVPYFWMQQILLEQLLWYTTELQQKCKQLTWLLQKSLSINGHDLIICCTHCNQFFTQQLGKYLEVYNIRFHMDWLHLLLCEKSQTKVVSPEGVQTGLTTHKLTPQHNKQHSLLLRNSQVQAVLQRTAEICPLYLKQHNESPEHN